MIERIGRGALIGTLLGLLVVAGEFLGAGPARSQGGGTVELTAPQGEVLLTVSGAITQSNTPDGSAELDRAQLAALPQTEITTSTIWTKGVQHFSGVELRTLLDALGASGTMLRVIALNDYVVEIPADEIVAGGALLASQRNDAPMSVRDKGPLWIIYPYDSSDDFRTEVIYSRSVWQVNRIEVLP